ncbi:hypothetical protein [Candidatus Mycoplasma haematominutum]|uniref:Uncharacterized protein n=1 Tax=Candidatus Mycoplasma haematominutum 'Birmingham 1' TaxID=1116213 RepID=G8C2Q9_9MOLU|nr:hypothetical protein [Candidatus Mycoplasma haematominutum]CCE66607.1 hypothetical protein MHM_00890 [Candidatus Mycoplasma haematominutum 'Birmingham 1']
MSTTVLRILVSLGSAVGISGAVAVPVVLNSGGGENVSSSRSRRAAATTVSMNTCETNEAGSQISFGEQGVREVCWKTGSAFNSLTSASEYTDFFKNRWGFGNEDWNNNYNQDEWTQQCIGGSEISSPWAIVASSASGGFQHLGYKCDADPNSTKFVKKTKSPAGVDNREQLKLWICESQCWTTQDNTIAGSIVVLEHEKTENWKEVLFQQKLAN